MIKILTIIGARPQFIKASVVSKTVVETDGISEVIVHTGQHFDANMSDIFFKQLSIPRPNYQLDVNGGSHGQMTGKMLVEVEKIIQQEKPDYVLVYGDTNSTLAGSLAAAKLHIPIAHVEAGLRSFNMRMPEEVNRILTDRVSNILFCPTQTAVENLLNEGFPFITSNSQIQRVKKVGDVMQDSVELFASRAIAPENFKLDDGFVLATVHRAENTNAPERLEKILVALNEVARTSPVVLPIHPRTRNIIANLRLDIKNLTLIAPVGYLEMLWLLKHCGLVATDSGGVQKEAFFMGKSCITMREETEWLELIEIGANELVGADEFKIISAAREKLNTRVKDENLIFGGGMAAERIVKTILE